MSDDMNRAREKQQYKLHQGHSAVKLCHWMQQSLLKGRPCYKQEFYGIRTHRCLQMTPVVNQCSQNCLFCWRVQGFDDRIERWSEPEQMLDACIEEQRKLVSGFGGDSRCSREMWKEAREPRHVAISLSGEPTIYPYLSDFIELCHRRGMTTFLVTNGTFPEALERLDPLPLNYTSRSPPPMRRYTSDCACLVDLTDGGG
jgi:tRNA wybutosine-synthesizing protein 1